MDETNDIESTESTTSLDGARNEEKSQLILQSDDSVYKSIHEKKGEILDEIRKDGLNVNANDFIVQSIVSKSVSYIKTKTQDMKDNDENQSRYSFPSSKQCSNDNTNEAKIRIEESKRFQYSYNEKCLPENAYSSDLYCNKKRDIAFQVSHSTDDLTDASSLGFELNTSTHKQWQTPFPYQESVPIPQVLPPPGGIAPLGIQQNNIRNSFPPQTYKAAPIYNNNPTTNDYFPYDMMDLDEFSAMSNYNRLANVTMCSYSNSAYPPMMNNMQYNPNSAISSPSRPSKVVRSSIPIDGYIYQVQFKRSHRNFILAPSAPRNIIPGDFVKVEADRGEDMGIVLSKTLANDFEEVAPTAGYRGRGFSSGSGDKKFLFRPATPDERASLSIKVQDEEIALEVIREKVLERCLPMMILDAEYQYDRHKLTFFFEAERRIDFRELVSELFSQYKTRIWMQQGTELAQATGFLPSSHVNSNYSLVKSPYQFKHDYYGDSNSYNSPNTSPNHKNNTASRGYYPNSNNHDFHFPDVNSTAASTASGIKPLFESSSMWNFG